MEEKKVNYWKWAFFVLVGILFISGCYLATKVTSQTKEQTNIAKVSDKNSKQKYTSVDVTLDKKQAKSSNTADVAKKESPKTTVKNTKSVAKKSTAKKDTTSKSKPATKKTSTTKSVAKKTSATSKTVATKKTTTKKTTSKTTATINYYLRKNQKKGKIKYRFLVDKSAIMMGTTKILGKNVSFTLYTKPTLDKNGNILLKVKSVAIGSLNAPAGFILKYVKNNYDLGKVAIIDPKAKTITLDLNQLTKKQDVLVKGTKLDLVNDEFKFNVKVPLK